MSPTRLGGDILFFLSQIVISSYVKVPNTYINGVVNFLQIVFSNRNISNILHASITQEIEQITMASYYGWKLPKKSAIQ
jgi:hypothetical protein